MMSDAYRLRTNTYFQRVEDENVQPGSVVFIACEGNKAEYHYFKNVSCFGERAGIGKLVRVEVLKLQNNDTQSSPEKVLDLLQEVVDMQRLGIQVERISKILPQLEVEAQELLEKYLKDPSSVDNVSVADIGKTLRANGFDIAYMRFLADCGDRDDVFCLVLDRDNGSHSQKQLEKLIGECKNRGYHLCLTSPCFEFWLLLHLCNVSQTYSPAQLDEIKRNPKVSNKHTFVSREVSNLTRQGKGVSAKVFEKHYLDNIQYAIDQANDFSTDLDALVKAGSLGTNLPALFSFLR